MRTERRKLRNDHRRYCNNSYLAAVLGSFIIYGILQQQYEGCLIGSNAFAVVRSPSRSRARWYPLELFDARQDDNHQHDSYIQQSRTRREILIESTVLPLGIVGASQPAFASTVTTSSSSSSSVTLSQSTAASSSASSTPSTTYMDITGTTTSAPKLRIPRVGYSLYKTTAEQVDDGVLTALKAGVRHFDVATDYGTNEIVGRILQEYIENGLGIDGVPKDKRSRRKELFITHKLSNAEQSTDPIAIENAVLTAQEQLLGSIRGIKDTTLDMVMIHSPLTNREKRLRSYETLVELQKNKQIKGVGVCHYGVEALNEIITAYLPAPSYIQLVLSPFNQHKDVVVWANQYGSVVGCNAWSKLSSTLGPVAGWTVLSEIAKRKGMTNAQVLIRWAVQRNYIAVPRSAAKYKIEKQNIFENSWNGISKFVLTDEEMNILNNLDEKYPVGRLGVTDGWSEQQIKNGHWDPTTATLQV